MASKIEVSFGARLTNAQKLMSILPTLSNFSPQHADDSSTGFSTLIEALEYANNMESAKEASYREVVAKRREAYSGKKNSIKARITEIKNAIHNIYGKNSIQATEVDAILKSATNTKLLKKTTTLADGTEKTRNYSFSQQSFGAQLGFFSDIVAKVSSYANYNPVRQELQPAELNAFLAQVRGLNADVTTAELEHTQSINARREVYERLKASGDRLKAYFLDVYGKESEEHDFIKELVF